MILLVLQGETLMLSRKLKTIEKLKRTVFTMDCIANDDKLIRFYTGFTSYDIFVAFFEFLGPSVTQLNYWGEKDVHTYHHSRKLDPINQLFLTLMKLKLDLKYLNLSVRFGISKTPVSRHFTTWVCFLYQHLNKIQWVPSVEQVRATLPKAFHDKYETAFAIIDASEVLYKVPSDLHMQSSTWSNYKHNNTAKFLIACTPNGAICYISPLFVGSISDVELTQVSGLLEKLDRKKRDLNNGRSWFHNTRTAADDWSCS